MLDQLKLEDAKTDFHMNSISRIISALIGGTLFSAIGLAAFDFQFNTFVMALGASLLGGIFLAVISILLMNFIQHDSS